MTAPAGRWFERPLTWLGQAADGAVLGAMRLAVERLLMPDPEELAGMLAAAEPYATGELARDPGRFFAFDREALEPRAVRERVRADLGDGRILRYRLATALTPWAGPPWPEDAVRLEHWAHGARPRGVVLGLHGFVMGRPGVDARVLMATAWYRRGYDVALLTLPYHGRRTPPDARFSGERFAATDPGALNEAVRRAVGEILLVSRWLAARTGAPVGLIGLSLGGYLAALVAGLTDDLAFVVPMVAPVCFGDLAWRFYRASPRRSREAGVTLERLRDAYRVHSPLTHPPRIPRDRLLIVAGRGDRVVPPEHPQALWKHWGGPAIHWFSGGHVLPIGRSGIVRRVAAHLGRTTSG